MHVIYRKIRHARYLYIKRNVKKVWGARYTLGARYISKNMVIHVWFEHKTHVQRHQKLARACLFISLAACLLYNVIDKCM